MDLSAVQSILYPIIAYLIFLFRTILKSILSLPIVYPIVKKFAHHKLNEAGIFINGKNPEEDLQLTSAKHEKEFILRLAIDGELGLGETYMQGLWECKSINKLMFRLLTSDLYKEATNPVNSFISYMLHNLFNMQCKSKAFEVGRHHYDLGNELFESFLDPTMRYSCAYWKNATNLTEAQAHKLELIASKLKLSPGMKVLDIGCGWGGLAKYLAQTYQVEVVGITVGVNGAKYASEQCTNLNVDIRVMDYRDLLTSNEKFDRIVSIEMFEHVGSHNYGIFMDVLRHCLVHDELVLLQTAGTFDPRMERTDTWLLKYIFPNGEFPYYLDLLASLENKFVIEDWHNFGSDYNKTLLAWVDNFKEAWVNGKLRSTKKYDARFYRMWYFYLCTSAGCFEARKLHVWQIVLSKNGILGGYVSER